MPHFALVVPKPKPTPPCLFEDIGRFLKARLGKAPYDYRRARIYPKALGEEELPEEKLLLGGMTVERLWAVMEQEVGTWERKVRGGGVDCENREGEIFGWSEVNQEARIKGHGNLN